MEPLLGKTLAELQTIAIEAGLPRFVGKQLCEWIYRKRVTSFEQMTNISLKARQALQERYVIGRTEPTAEAVSKDGTRKYLFPIQAEMPDNRSIDSEKRTLNAQHSTLNAQHSTLFLIAGLWLLPPVQWIFSFDVVFAINYLWTATACLAFILLFRSMSQKGTSSAWHNALLFLFALICGNLHEGYSLLISGALFFYALMHFRQLNASQWCLICGMWAGTLTVIGSPGIWGRASGASADSLQEALVRKLDILRYSKRLYLLIAALAAAYFMLGKERLKTFVKEHQIELMIVLLGFAFLFMLPYYSQRMGFPMELFSVLLLLKLLLLTPFRKLLGRVSSVIIAVLLLIHVPMTVYYAKKVGNEYQQMLAEYEQSPTGVCHQQDFEVPKPFRPYIYRLGDDAELGIISFVHQKQMTIVPPNGK